jgi:8-oxo-dGTP diphosphatase
MIHKVLAYITRRRDGRTQLLVFDHRDAPDSGTQVPAGTVEDSEDIEAALFREIDEESGLKEVRLVRKLAEVEETGRDQIRHVFHLTAPEAALDRWSHTVQGRGEDAGLVFDYYWTNNDPGLRLAGNQHQWASQIEPG